VPDRSSRACAQAVRRHEAVRRRAMCLDYLVRELSCALRLRRFACGGDLLWVRSNGIHTAVILASQIYVFVNVW